ncbi:BsuPI-related putative proteinase inhibitor [Salirhabdus sp. Marseille-P4669]|uniref:BsuPI-related putative proteinase inhibitor n=1 Tax=Salirhabdus sp. Marseille-P4669 TaxID=2042310 RepID=UPI000C7C39E2|nr:BsuPI-related putative proteinase inhibitor [Salirhabdus sp. Marseille-P4669]
MKRLFVLSLLLFVAIAGCGTSENEEDQTSGSSSDNPVANDNDGTEELPTLDELEEQSVDTHALLEKLQYEVTTSVENGTVTFHMSLKNNASEAMQIGFSSGQQFEIVVKDTESNEEIYRYSEGKMFTEALVFKEIKPNETLDWTFEWEYGDMPTSEWIATVTLLPININEAPLDANPFMKDVSIRIDKEQESETQAAFRNLEVTGENGVYTITGEAKVTAGHFSYHVEDGHQILIEETNKTLKEGAPNWSPFEIDLQLNPTQLPINGTVSLFLYEHNPKDGSINNEAVVPLESFQP